MKPSIRLFSGGRQHSITKAQNPTHFPTWLFLEAAIRESWKRAFVNKTAQTNLPKLIPEFTEGTRLFP